MTDLDIALDLVSRLRAWSPGSGDNAIIESADTVVDAEGRIGLAIRWTQVTKDQGERKFGLTTSIRELLHERSTPGSPDPTEALSDLLLMVVEPHRSFPPSHPEVRSLFFGL
jgi:hypothetical protein